MLDLFARPWRRRSQNRGETFRLARHLVPKIDRLKTRQRRSYPEIESPLFWSAYERCSAFSLIHVPGFYNLYQSLHYIAANRIAGAAVECGCFLGGAAAFMGLLRQEWALDGLDIVLYDTFQGPPVGCSDVFRGGHPIETPSRLPNYERQVAATLRDILGSLDGIRLVVGLVEDTLPHTNPEAVALLRLDTDFYDSTRVELEHLYPRLVAGGVLIVDDYGSFQGSRRATDEYLRTLVRPPLLNRIDDGIWAGVKPGPFVAE